MTHPVEALKHCTAVPIPRSKLCVHLLARHRDHVPRVDAAAPRGARPPEAAAQAPRRQRYCLCGLS